MINNKIRAVLLKRKPDTHKGDYGHVFVIAGSLGMTGAAYLAAQAALLSGSGLVTLGIPKSLNNILSRKLVEVMTRPLPETKQQTLSLGAFPEIEKFIKARKPDVLVIGPGLSQNEGTQKLIRKIVFKTDLPAVIDADGLNALAGYKLRGTVITPHPAELGRLLGISVKKVQKDRKSVAKRAAADYNVITVLKGHNTVVADPGGRVYINKTGNPGMASAGCGDVLTGMIASFIGQGIRQPD
jgi:NAD(P)H-hydrate epimerase